MRRLLLVTILALSASANAAIDLTPTVTEYEGEGVLYRKVSFKGGDKPVSLALPFGWTCRGGATRLQLTPPSLAFSEGIVEVGPIKPSQKLDAVAIEAFKHQALTTLPAGGQLATLVSEQELLVFGQAPGYQVVIEFQNLGQKFRRSALVAYMGDTQLTFRFTAPKKAFDPLDKAFYRSVLAWDYAPPPKPDTVAQNAVSK